MTRYPIRAAKYAVQLVVLFFAIYFLMNAFSQVKVGLDVFFTLRGVWIIAAVVVFSLLYPFFGFTKKALSFDATKKVENVENVMQMCGFKRLPSPDDKMVFQAETQAKRVLMLYEDKLTITTENGESFIEGNRKEAFKAYFRMGTYIA